MRWNRPFTLVQSDRKEALYFIQGDKRVDPPAAISVAAPGHSGINAVTIGGIEVAETDGETIGAGRHTVTVEDGDRNTATETFTVIDSPPPPIIPPLCHSGRSEEPAPNPPNLALARYWHGGGGG